tara:strand:- start:282 stop:668 length:387 start_codon:yes stop_codon:yes gene_type:complete
MQIIGNGVDIVDHQRIKKALKKKNFIMRIYSANEIKQSKKTFNKTNFFAKRFAAKEAFVKALGTGFSNNINFKDISIKNIKSGMPKILVNKKVKVLIKKKFKLKNFKIFLSLSDERGHSIAFVILNKL